MNENTQDIIVYHGSKTKFDAFSYSFIGDNGTDEGKGFYFTTSKEIALHYAGADGYFLECKLTPTRIITDNAKTITADEYRKIITVMDEKCEYLSNYGEVGYDGFEKVFNWAKSAEFDDEDSDVELISGIANASGCIETTNRTLDELFGINCIIEYSPKWGGEQAIYVALIPEIITILNVYDAKSVEI